MNILAIDTSSVYASSAIMRDGVVIFEKALSCGLVHSKSVMPLIEDALKSVNMDIEEIDVFACVAGPGSFTGVRIGACAIKGLAQSLDKPCARVNSLDCLSFNSDAEYICPIMDARRGQVYTAVYKNGEIIRDYDVCPIEDVLEFVKGKKCTFTGDGIYVFREKIKEALGENALFTKPQHTYLRASSALYIAKKMAEEDKLISAAALDAIYLRKPQAEREYESRNS